MAINPPLWFFCINPRVDAIKQFKNGKKKEEIDAFDNITPLSAKNKICIDVGYSWLVFLLSVLVYYTYLTFDM